MTDKEKIELAVQLFLAQPGSCWCGEDGPIGGVHIPVCDKIAKFIEQNAEKTKPVA